jgi:UTP--glucose-1-phosphate uridylyltransferase
LLHAVQNFTSWTDTFLIIVPLYFDLFLFSGKMMSIWGLLLFAALLLTSTSLVKCEEEHEGHEDEAYPDHWAWGQLLELPATPTNKYYTIEIDRSATSFEYQLVNFTIAVIPLDENAVHMDEGFHHWFEEYLNPRVEAVWNETYVTTVKPNAILPIFNVTHMARLHVNLEANHDIATTRFFFASTGGKYALYGAHVQAEYNTAGLLVTSYTGARPTLIGTEYRTETATATSTAKNDDKPWGNAIGAAFAVWVIVFVGLVTVVFGLQPAHRHIHFLTMFGAGAIISTVTSIMTVESIHLIQSKYTDESEAAGYYSTLFLAGLITSPLLEVFLQCVGRSNMAQSDTVKGGAVELPTVEDRATEMGDNDADAEVGLETSKLEDENETPRVYVDIVDVVKDPVSCRLFSGVCLGDFFHNFSDGIFIGTAFMNCDSDLGWTIAASTIFHEFGQEVADFHALHNILRMPITQVLIYNAMSGFSVIIGVLVVMSADMESYQTGLLLTYGAGVYVYVALVELLSRAVNNNLSALNKLIGLIWFSIGAIAIGLVLLDHEHCSSSSNSSGGSSSSSGGAHEGHGH